MRHGRMLIPFLLISQVSCSQSCDCENEYLWVKNHMEKNHPGFNSDIKSPSSPAYKSFTNELLKKIRNEKSNKYCLIYLKQYIRYLKDHHSNINGRVAVQVNESDPASVNNFLKSPVYLETETLEVDSVELMKYFAKIDPGSLEGVYVTADTTYTVAVIKNKKQDRDYAGVILASKTPLWKKSQVKFELRDRADGYREGIFYLRNHSINYDEWLVEGSEAIPLYKKIYPASAPSIPLAADNNLISFKVLDSLTSCISIRSFGGQFSPQLDSAYKEIIPRIVKYPNLIIDVRNNGGGNDMNYYALMPLLYTNTISNDVVDLFVTDDNRKAYEQRRDEARNDPKRYGTAVYLSWQTRLNQMKNVASGTFVPITRPNSITEYKPVSGNPLKVVILYNRFCASTCEQLLLDAQFSKKVKLVGENSGGFIAYGNIMDIQTPCGNTLTWTTTRKNNDRKYEFVGITPHLKVPPSEKDWVEFARKSMQ